MSYPFSPLPLPPPPRPLHFIILRLRFLTQFAHDVRLHRRSTIPYVYSEYYCLDTALVGILIAVPTGCGVGSSMVAVCKYTQAVICVLDSRDCGRNNVSEELVLVAVTGVAKMADTGRLMRWGMVVGCLAPVALALGGDYYAQVR